MTQKEIIEFEETNTGVIRLYLEGSFYQAYERSGRVSEAKSESVTARSQRRFHLCHCRIVFS